MGKDKREKQAATSSKAQELLLRQGGGGGFGGFSGSTSVGAGGFAFGARYVEQVSAAAPAAAQAAATGGAAGGDAVPRAAVIPADLDGELAQQLQKLSKRDATTRLKALQALRALAAAKPESEVVSALPAWAFLFSRLVIDGSRAVRAEAGHVMGALAAASGRKIAPFLRALLPSWWLAQFDIAADAATAAKAAFAAAFSTEAKRRDAVLFCRAEVLQLLSDNLASTPQSLGDAKKEPVEELADRHERVLAASCSALAALVALASASGGGAVEEADSSGADGTAGGEGGARAEQAKEVLQGVVRQLEQPSFYKAVLNSKAAAVRRAAYRLVAAVSALRPPALPGGTVQVAAPAVLGAIGEREAGNHGAMWEMQLGFAVAYPAAWKAVNMQKAFLPRLWALLRHGCYGSAAASYPAVLPLVALLPSSLLGPQPGFFASLLTSVWAGLGQAGSPASQRAAAGCFQECLLYALLKAGQLASSGGAVEALAAPSDAAAPAAAAAAGLEYSRQLLGAVLPETVLPAATLAAAAGTPGGQAAAGTLSGLVRRLSQPPGSGSSTLGDDRVYSLQPPLDLLLSEVGRHVAAAVRSELEAGQSQEEGGQAQPGTSLEQVSALVVALTEAAAGEQARAAVGAAVAQPLVAILLPEVRTGIAGPPAASLLASLLKAFPQHAAAPAAAASPGDELPAAASPEGAAAVSATGQQFEALRLDQSASFTIDSLVRQLVEGKQQDAAPGALAAACDLLLSCLPQVRAPGTKLGEVVQQLLERGQHGTATLLLQHVVSGAAGGALGVLSCRSRQLDAAAASLADRPEQDPQLLVLLMVGDGRQSLLSLAACAAALEQLRARVESAAAPADAGSESGVVAALRVAAGSVLSPALGGASGDLAVVQAQLSLLAAVFGVLVCEAAQEPASYESHGSDASQGSEDSDSEADAGDGSPRSQQPQEAQALAASIWQNAGHFGQLLERASVAAQEHLVAAVEGTLLAAVEGGQPQEGEEEEDAVLAALVSRADRLARAAQLAVAATAIAGQLEHQLLHGLLLGHAPAAGAAGGGSSSSGGSPDDSSSLATCSAARAAFLVQLGQSVGFDKLLGAAKESAGPSSSTASTSSAAEGATGAAAAAAGMAVSVLAALLEAASVALEAAAQPLVDHVAGDAALLAAALPLSLQAAEGGADEATLVLCCLLEAATSPTSSSDVAGAAAVAAAAFFEQHIAGAWRQQAELPPPLLELLSAVLAVAAPALRRSEELLQRSGLPSLTRWLCEQSAMAEPVALAAPTTNGKPADGVEEGEEGSPLPLLVLRAAVTCFPCSTTAAQVAASGGGGEFRRGDAVWYLLHDGTWAEAAVMAVNSSVQPASYGIELVAAGAGTGGSSGYRETEAHRLKPRRPGAPAPLPALPPAARQQEAVPASEAGERAELQRLLLHQTRGLRGAALARDAPSAGAQAAVAALTHAAVAYCGPELGRQQWAAAVDQSNAALVSSTAQLAAAVGAVVAAVSSAAAGVGGASLSSPPLALQFWRRLQQRGVLAKSAKAQAELAAAATALQGALVTLEQQLLPLLLPALETYTLAAAAAARGACALSAGDWQRAEAAACSELLQLFLSLGALAAVAAAVGDQLSQMLADWLQGGSSGLGQLWSLLGRHVVVIVREADRPFLLEAVDRANAEIEATGVDCLGCLLGLAINAAAPLPLAAAAFQALLAHPELVAALTAAEGVDEDELARQQEEAALQASGSAGSGGGSSSSEAAVLLEQVGVRPELAGVVGSGLGGVGASSGGSGSGGGRHPRFLEGWGLLVGHMLAAAPESHGRRLLSQTLKEIHDMVPSLLDTVVQLLPLQQGGSGRRDSSGGASGGTPPPRTASVGEAAAAAVGPDSGGAARAADPGAAFTSALAALDLPLVLDHPQQQQQQQGQQQAQRLAALLYWGVLQALPASARLWFSDLRDRALAAAVERYTAAAVTQALLAAELAAVASLASTFGKYDKFSVRASATAREVVAVMEVEEGHQLELAVRLPASMPLRPPEVECRRKVGVAEGRLRKWLLSISALLRNQNGGVAQAIGLWKRNVDKEFEGQEECLICYSIIQPTSGQLPRLGCHTCRKKFHPQCLYKWFKSSGKSNCPHCQSPW